jgi:hypothetical protein
VESNLIENRVARSIYPPWHGCASTTALESCRKRFDISSFFPLRLEGLIEEDNGGRREAGGSPMWRIDPAGVGGFSEESSSRFHNVDDPGIEK